MHRETEPSLISDIEKLNLEHVESINEPQVLTSEHHDFLMKRHGSIQLVPLPSSDPADPLNWSSWKKNYEIILIAFQTFTSTFMSSGLAPAYDSMAEEYGVLPHEASYLTSAQICVLGIFPLFWVPIMNTYGRRPFLTFSVLVCCALNIAGGFCTTYGQQMATRILLALFISTGVSAGSSVVADLSFSHERGKKNGWWSLGLIMGTPGGGFFMGFVQYHVGTKWIFFTFAIMNFIQFILWLLADETVYARNVETTNARLNKRGLKNWLGFCRQTDKELNWKIFIRPLKQAASFNVSMAVIAASLTFCYANILLVVEMPQTFGVMFDLNAQQLSLHYIALIVGSIIGELLSGHVSDWWMLICYKERGGKRVIVDRLWVSYYGFLAVIVGLVVWGVYLNKVEQNHWTISPLIGAAVMAVGNDIVATVLTAFALDSHSEYASDIGLYLNLVRQIYGFIGPFYLTLMIETLSYAGAAGLMIGLMVVFGFGPTALAHLIGLRHIHTKA
ncbi:uncharacterized protein AC631_05751 [Debaryomyces fabryi]|uniref:Major facilitator superfamily (MFS) profile domain-containing protein n=1 Tax=Debaryomyces fabryi TaxID=58627 RepID=A0A0V1PQT1_9ASCO|nr:uncharacterized protein AC631_05751 [Debaryomyces fabryi]KRZ98489.1 hypothetical protein AC631_05751 [Debaryomyces fabryi]CUM49414.1 unnamed protein product [Debaryomyces fabryi]